jgi:hypothetical protein
MSFKVAMAPQASSLMGRPSVASIRARRTTKPKAVDRQIGN